MATINRHVSTNNTETPLVSILIFNYNYGRFLRQCIESVLNQTYSNIEICLSDNASSDDSWDIALEYQRQYPDIINLACNRLNFGSDANLLNLTFFKRGKYHVQMCSDDAMVPDFVEKCVRVLETNPECGYVIANRAIMDENGNLTDEPPFYNQSCIIKGDEQAAVYMMAAVNPSVSQIMYVANRTTIHGASVSKELSGRWYGTRLMDFLLCCNYPMAYIKEPLLLHRLHGENDSLNAADNLIEIVGPFLLNHQYAEIAQHYNLSKVVERLPKATEKLSKLCLRYCTRFLINGIETIAEQYYHLALALSPSVKSEKIFKVITTYWHAEKKKKEYIRNELNKVSNLITRAVSYDPPPESIALDFFLNENR